MMKNKKIKSINFNLQLKTVNNDNKSPLFSFDFMTTNNKYNFANLSDDDKLALINKIHDYRNKTWLDVKNEPRHNKGSEKIKSKIELPASVKEDTTLLALRYNGLKAMIGYREERIFHIIYFDPNFKLYNHG